MRNLVLKKPVITESCENFSINSWRSPQNQISWTGMLSEDMQRGIFKDIIAKII